MSILSLLMSVVMALSLSIGAPDQGMGSYQLEITSGIEAEGLWDAFSMQDLIMPENQAAPSAVLRDVQKLLDAVKLRAQTAKNALKLELLSVDGAALADVSIFLEEGTYTLVTSLLPGMALTYSEDFAVAHTPERRNDRIKAWSHIPFQIVERYDGRHGHFRPRLYRCWITRSFKNQ